jgi:hypothetical protein
VPAGCFEALAEAMHVTWQQPLEKLEEMGGAGAELVAKQHDAAPKEASKLVALFCSNMEK